MTPASCSSSTGQARAFRPGLRFGRPQRQQSTLDDLASLERVLPEPADVRRRADVFLLAIVDSHDRDSQAAACRLLGIKAQSLEKRIIAAQDGD